MAKVLEVTNLKKVYKGRKKGNKCLINAVDDISFSIYEGEVVGFLGPNGAGKSTTIKLISGMATPTSGKITVLDYDVFSQRELAMQHVGGVIENPDLYKDWTGKNNLLYLATLHPRETMEKAQQENDKEHTTAHLTKKQLDELRVNSLLSLVGLSDRGDSLVKTYSLGMKQRLGIAQALLSQPKLLILDEPANGLDPAGIKEIRDLLRILAHEHNMAVLVSSHILSEMQLMCDRVIIIDNGKIISEHKMGDLANLAEGQKTVCITTNEPVKAKEFLEKEKAIASTLTAHGIECSTSLDTGEITKALVMAGIDVSGVSVKEKSLEDIFMKATHGGEDNV